MNRKDTLEFQTTAVRVSGVSIGVNALLSALKLAAGLFAHSGAMVSDAVHSASDVFSSIVVIIGVKLASREADPEHPYGHDRLECAAAIVLAMILCITGFFIGHVAVENLTSDGAVELPVPGLAALAAAVISIAVKEGLYWYTRHFARLLDSSALMADAWHHRSDALSSVGALVGIWGARRGILWLDSAASLVICCFIVKAAYDIFRDAMQKLVDHACSGELEQAIRSCAVVQPGVRSVRRLTTREFGSRIYVDLEIGADGELTLVQSNAIAEGVHRKIEADFPKVKHISVRAVPDRAEAGEQKNEIL